MALIESTCLLFFNTTGFGGFSSVFFVGGLAGRRWSLTGSSSRLFFLTLDFLFLDFLRETFYLRWLVDEWSKSNLMSPKTFI